MGFHHQNYINNSLGIHVIDTDDPDEAARTILWKAP